MSLHSKDIDSAFDGAGKKLGLEIWCIENLQLVSVPKSSHGKFYTGSAYVILNTALLKSGPPQHDIHYWLGNDVNKEDSTLVSDKALELDAALGSCTVQYREVQGQETEKFLSYFRPCIIPLDGKYSLRSGKSNGETYKISMLTCKGDHVVRVKEVPFSRSSLNHNDVFIVDTASKIFLFSGCNSSIQERAKALEVVQYIKEDKHGGKCEVATRMGNLLEILMLVNFGVYLVVMLLFPGIHLLLFSNNLILLPLRFSGLIFRENYVKLQPIC